MALAFCAPTNTALACLQLPRIDPSGERIFLPADSYAVPAPPVIAQPAVAQPAAPAQVVVALAPAETVASVGSRVMLIATVNGPQGLPLAGQRVDWILTGAGQFVATEAFSAWNPFRWGREAPQILTTAHAVGRTASAPQVVTRGTPHTADDVPLQRGQAWIDVGSLTEGISQVTAYPPTSGWAGPKGAAVIHWIDGQWVFPPPTTAPVGTRLMLTTTVARRTNGAPIAGWKVRYQIVDGPRVALGTSGAQAVEVDTDGSGRAGIEVVEREPNVGTTRLSVQVLRPPLAGQADPRSLVLGNGTTSVTWAATAAAPAPAPVAAPPPTSPAVPPATPAPATPEAPRPLLEVTVRGPAEARVGSTVRFEIVVSNRSSVAAQDVTISDAFDEGLEHAVAKGAIERRLGNLGPGAAVSAPVDFRVARTGRLCHRVEVAASGGARAAASACLQATQPEPQAQPALEVTKSGPRQQRAGESAIFVINVHNTGNVPLTGLRVTDTYERALEPTDASAGFTIQQEELVWEVPRLDPGQSRTFRVRCRCVETHEKACGRVIVTSNERPPIAAEACLEILPATSPSAPPQIPAEQPQPLPPEASTPVAPSRLQIAIADLADPVRVGERLTYQIRITNDGTTEDRSVVVSLTFPDGLVPERVGTRGPATYETQDLSIRFAPVATIRPGETLTYVVPFQAGRSGTARVVAHLQSEGLRAPQTMEEVTQILER